VIAQWMVYSCVLGLLLFGGAAAGERVIRALGLPSRPLWLMALAATALLPFAMGRGRPARASGGGAGAAGLVGEREVSFVGPILTPAVGERLDALLVGLWMIASAFLVLRLVRAVIAVRRRSRGWRAAKIEGSWVEVSAGTGPAVVGVLEPKIVLPEWALRLDRGSLRLLLEHEREHVRAGDPRALLAGILAVAAFPWNPALWLQNRRLRHAVEVDCDQRVVRWSGHRRRYGELLLMAAERTVRGRSLAPVISAASPPLERRIHHLTGAARGRWSTMLRWTGLALVLPALAILVPQPSTPPIRNAFATAVSALAGSPGDAFPAGAPDSPAQLLNRHEAPEILARAYPPRLREAGIGGTVIVWTHVRADGRVAHSTIFESSGHPELDEAAQHAIGEFRFRPARVDGRVSAGWSRQPVTFVPSAPERTLARSSVEAGSRVAIWRTPSPAMALVQVR
jgi:TonB family protein